MVAGKSTGYGCAYLSRFITRRQRSRLVIASALDQRRPQRPAVERPTLGAPQTQVPRSPPVSHRGVALRDDAP